MKTRKKEADQSGIGRAITLIPQISLCIIIPEILCLAIGAWLDHLFSWQHWGMVGFMVLGMVVGMRNAFVFAKNYVKQEAQRYQKEQSPEYDLMAGWNETTKVLDALEQEQEAEKTAETGKTAETDAAGTDAAETDATGTQDRVTAAQEDRYE